MAFFFPALLGMVWLLLSGSAQSAPALHERPFTASDCRQGVDLSETRLQLKIDPETGRLDGSYSSLLHNRSDQALSAPCFVLNPGLELQAIAQPLLESLEREPPQGNNPLLYRAQLKRPLAPGASLRLQLHYAGTLQATPKFGRIQPEDILLTAQSFFYPRFERGTQRACPVALTVSLPKAYLPVASGTRQKAQTSPAGFVLSPEGLCGLRNEDGIDLIAAPFQLRENAWLRLYERPATPDQALSSQRFARLSGEFASLLSALEKQFGEHDFVSFQLVATPRDDLGGMAKHNTVFLSEKHFGEPAKVAPQAWAYFTQRTGSESAAEAEFDFYRRTVLAHESAHLFLNRLDGDSPWMAKGLAEFTGVASLLISEQADVAQRRLAEHRGSWRNAQPEGLPALNDAQLNSESGYRVNYQGTPLVFWEMAQRRGDAFWPLWRDWLSERRSGPLRYTDFKAHFQLNARESAWFEQAFAPAELTAPLPSP
ncbi:MAG: hypothetical protein ACO1RX_07650 [Candidatus Sericytochromatia bacterium]